MKLTVSVVSAWEISLQPELGIADVVPWLRQAAGQLQARLLPVRLQHIAALEQLPFRHRDPFDRLLIAQAPAGEFSLVTADQAIGNIRRPHASGIRGAMVSPVLLQLRCEHPTPDLIRRESKAGGDCHTEVARDLSERLQMEAGNSVSRLVIRECRSVPSAEGACARSREQFYDLNDEEMVAMRLVGSFRSIEAKEMRSDQKLNRLLAEGLMERKSLVLQHAGKRADVLILTRKGGITWPREPGRQRQRYYAGLVKAGRTGARSGDLSGIQTGGGPIEKAGGRIKRVVLDHEFKSIAASRMNRLEGPTRPTGAQNWPPNWSCQSSKITWRCPICGSNTRTPRARNSTGISRS